jgi:hypothetical protein
MRIIFWCEFPRNVDLKQLGTILKEINLDIEVYIAAKSLKEFNYFKKEFSKIKNIKSIGCWPVLSKDKGYWFSSFTDKESLNSLLQYKDLKLKIDIEPPIENFKFSYFRLKLWLLKYCLFLKPKNKGLLSEVLSKLKKEDIIMSTFPFPKFMLNNLMDITYLKNSNLSLMFYSTLIPRIFRPFYRMYYKSIITSYREIAKNIFSAVGLIGTGIFGNEPIYKSVKEFEKDLKFLRSLNIDRIAIFELSWILKRRNSKEWFKIIIG